MINVKKLKESLTTDNIITLLDSLGADCTKQSDKELIFSSICCRENAREHSAKLYYYVESQSFYCYKCQTHCDIIELVKLVKNLSFIDALAWICDELHIDSEIFQRKSSIVQYDWKRDLSRYLKRSIDYDDLVVYDDKILNFFKQEYYTGWMEEGISIETMEKYEIGWYDSNNTITIPVRDDNDNLVGIHGRNLDPFDVECGRKYTPVKLLDGTEYRFPTSQVLFGLNHTKENIIKTKEIVLFEAPKSVLQMDTITNCNNSVGLFGINCSKYKRDYILSLGVESVVIALDRQYHDVMEKNAESCEFLQYKKNVEKIANLFSGFANVYVVFDDKHRLDYKDSPSDKGKYVWEELYNERVEYNDSTRID